MIGPWLGCFCRDAVVPQTTKMSARFLDYLLGKGGLVVVVVVVVAVDVPTCVWDGSSLFACGLDDMIIWVPHSCHKMLV